MRLAFVFTILLFTSVSLIAQAPAGEAGKATATSTDEPAVTGLPKQGPDLRIEESKIPDPRSYTRPDAGTRRKRFVNSVVGPVALGKTLVSAGISTWRKSPEEWGTKWDGFGRRVASSFGKNAIKQTTKFGLDEALKYDSHYYRSTKKDFGSRVTNALISPVTARDRDGKRVIGIPNLVGTYTANVVAYESWYPKRYDWKDGLRGGTISLGLNAAFNLVKEFVLKK